MSTETPPHGETTVDRIWSTVARPEILGGGCLVAGGLLVGAAVRSSGGGWLEPLRAASVLPFVAGLLTLVAVLWVGMIWDRESDARVADIAGRRSRLASRRLPTIGATTLLVGAATLIASWLFTQADKPPGTVTLPAGEKTESFQSRIGGQTVDVMLPMRMHLQQVSLDPVPSVQVAFSRPGEDPFGQRRLRPGETVAMEGYRLAPTGLSGAEGNLQAVIASTREDTIKAAAGTGEAFKLAPQGPEYKVADITRNYMQALGPAVRLENDELGSFWAFQKPDKADGFPELRHDLYVESLQRAPGVTFTVTPDFPVWPIGLGGSLFVCGLAILVAFPERIRRGGAVESFNDAGSLADAQLEDEEAT
jgi:hypothetical protein